MGFLERILQEPSFERRADSFVIRVATLNEVEQLSPFTFEAINSTKQLLTPYPSDVISTAQQMNLTPSELTTMRDSVDRESAYQNIVGVVIRGPADDYQHAEKILAQSTVAIAKMAASLRGKAMDPWTLNVYLDDETRLKMLLYYSSFVFR